MNVYTRPYNIDFNKLYLEEYMEGLPAMLEIIQAIATDVKVLYNPDPYGGNYKYISFQCDKSNLFSIIETIIDTTDNDVTIFHFHDEKFGGTITPH